MENHDPRSSRHYYLNTATVGRPPRAPPPACLACLRARVSVCVPQAALPCGVRHSSLQLLPAAHPPGPSPSAPAGLKTWERPEASACALIKTTQTSHEQPSAMRPRKNGEGAEGVVAQA